MFAPIREKMTTEDFYRFVETADKRYELIEGEAIEMPPPIPVHQRKIRKLLLHLESLKLGGECFISPIEVELDAENAPQPDLLWIAPNGKCVVGEKRLYGAPDLIVEVFSPKTTRYDKKEKFQLYERFGVREYWMINPLEEYIEVFHLVEGKYQLLGVFGIEDTFVSPTLNNSTITVNQIFKD
jgi:Uma2 family endonuclease